MGRIDVLAIDPGITTGYCHAVIDDDGCTVKPFQNKDEVWDHYNLLDRVHPDIIVIEDFQYRNRQRSGLILFSVQLIGVSRLWAFRESAQLVLQTPAQGKSYWSNTLLQEKKVYKRGIPHAMDATRHLMQWLTFGGGFRFVKPDDPITLIK